MEVKFIVHILKLFVHSSCATSEKDFRTCRELYEKDKGKKSNEIQKRFFGATQNAIV